MLSIDQYSYTLSLKRWACWVKNKQYCSYFYQKIRFRHDCKLSVLLILGDNLHEMANPIFCTGKKLKKPQNIVVCWISPKCAKPSMSVLVSVALGLHCSSFPVWIFWINTVYSTGVFLFLYSVTYHNKSIYSLGQLHYSWMSPIVEVFCKKNYSPFF